MAFKIKKPQFEPKTSGLTFYGAMRLRLLLEDLETTEAPLERPVERSVEPAEGNRSEAAPSVVPWLPPRPPKLL